MSIFFLYYFLQTWCCVQSWGEYIWRNFRDRTCDVWAVLMVILFKQKTAYRSIKGVVSRHTHDQTTKRKPPFLRPSFYFCNNHKKLTKNMIYLTSRQIHKNYDFSRQLRRWDWLQSTETRKYRRFDPGDVRSFWTTWWGGRLH